MAGVVVKPQVTVEIVFFTSRMLMAFCLYICLMNLPICFHCVFLASSVGWPDGRAGCMC